MKVFTKPIRYGPESLADPCKGTDRFKCVSEANAQLLSSASLDSQLDRLFAMSVHDAPLESSVAMYALGADYLQGCWSCRRTHVSDHEG